MIEENWREGGTIFSLMLFYEEGTDCVYSLTSAKTITVCCLPPHCDCLLVGTLGGITYPMDTQFDGMSPEVLSWSRARAVLGYKGKDIPGEVRTLDISPRNPKQVGT